MQLIKIREELSQYNSVEIFNKEMYHSHNDEEYNFFWKYPNINLSLKNSGLQRYFLLTEEKEFLTSDHYLREHYDVTIFKHNRYSFPYYHSHDFFELLFVWSGTATHHVGEKEYLMQKGQVCIVPPGTHHSLSVFDDSIVIDILFKNNVQGTVLRELIGENTVLSNFFEDCLYNKKTEGNGYIIADTNADPDFESLILQMFDENSSERKYANVVLEALLLMFLSRLVQKYESSVEYISVGNYVNAKSVVDAILLYIHEHLNDVTLDDIAEKFHFNKYYASRLIKNHTELTFTQLIRMIRLLEVKKMLVSTSLSLAKICEIVGYCDTSNLVKAFKKEYGITPSQYRSSSKNSNIIMS